MGSSSAEGPWGVFLHECLKRRIDALEFRDLSKLLLSRCPVSEPALLDILLESQAASHAKWDPLLPLYIDSLRRLGKLKPATVLESLLRHSSILSSTTSSTPAASEEKNKNKKKLKTNGNDSTSGTFMRDIKVVQDVVLSVSAGQIPATASEAAGVFLAVAEWILAVVAWHHATLDEAQQTGGFMSSPDAVSLFESLGILLAALSGSAKGLELLSLDHNEGDALPPPPPPLVLASD